MIVSSRTPEGFHHRCPVCNKNVVLVPSTFPIHDAPCPNCGTLLVLTAENLERSSPPQTLPVRREYWYSILWSPLSIFTFAIHGAQVIESITSNAVGPPLIFLLACMLYFVMGVITLWIGLSTRAQLDRYLKYFEKNLELVADVKRDRVVHQSLIALGVVMITPVIWPVAALLGLL